jgi:hypothetical protein
MSEIKVNSIKGVGASAAAITVNNTDGTCIANLTNRTNKNLVINGACLIAQRGVSGSSYGYMAVDRFRTGASQVDENPTTEQVDVASGTTPYTNGFTKAIKLTNGNQTSGAGTGDAMNFTYRLEAQDIRNSGWNYLSSSSYITLSFWCKSSVAQTFYGRLYTTDGTAYNYPFSMGSLSANTWTKITKTIPGNSNLTFDNNAEQGLAIEFATFNGTAKTDSGVALDTWAAYNTATRMPDFTSTWYTTNDSTWELTGVQLEVGSVATDFEHRSFGQELALCQRYYYRWTAGATNRFAWMGMSYSTTTCFGIVKPFPVEMRTAPTCSVSGTYKPFGSDGSTSGHTAFSSTAIDKATKYEMSSSGWGGATGIQEGGRPVVVDASEAEAYIDASAEL